ncbi:MAG: hypothetical protein ACE5FU_14620, partial [Nitrospinota bacterium]
MKPILVFPSVLISFQCPYCNVTGKIKGKQPPEKDFVFRCPGCKNKVLVKLNNRGAYRKTVSIDVVYAASAVTNRTGDELHRGKIIDISITGLK